MGNLQFGFFAGEGVSTPIFNYVDSGGAWQSSSNPGYSVSVDGNHIIIDILSYLIPPNGKYYFFTDDGSNCDDVGLGPDGPVSVLPPDGPIVLLDNSDGGEQPSVATFTDFSGDAKFCHADNLIDNPGVDIQRVDILYDPTGTSGAFMVDVFTGDPGPAALENFSFATVVDLVLGVEVQASFFWDFHDETIVAGKSDPFTGEQIDTHAQIDIREDDQLGMPGSVVSFGIQLFDLPMEYDSMRVFTYRLPVAGESTFCDDAVVFFQPPIVQDPAATDE